MATGRLEAFSDGVVAILITIMVLELKVPHGTDFVMSHASMGANTIFNLLQRSDIEMLAAGIDLFRVPVPLRLAGRSIADCAVQRRTGTTIAAYLRKTACGLTLIHKRSCPPAANCC